MSYYETNKEAIKQYQKLYYQKNKNKAKHYNKEYFVKSYQLKREQLLEYQKNYQKENKEKYNAYQTQYYHTKRKSDPEYHSKRLAYQRKYQERKNKPLVEQRQIKRTKKFMTKVLSELLKTVPLYECVTPDQEPILVAEPVITPFAGVRIDKRGYFVLDW